MKGSKHMKTITKFIYPAFGALALAWLAISPVAQAVVPAPDGGYPGFNTAEGQNALFSLTTGSANTAVGWHSLSNNSEGNFNTATGAGALLFNTTDNNTAFGAATLLFNTTGISNTAVGAAALLNNTEGAENTATGRSALRNNTTGGANTANGIQALMSNTTGLVNTANGCQALVSNTTGSINTAIGFKALLNNTNGERNTALGFLAGDAVTTADNVIAIGTSGANVSNSCYIGQIFDRTSSGGTAVFINSAGRLGTTTSSRRYKDEIKSMEQASEALFALKPVTFRYKKEIDPQGISQFGLVAEDVEAVNPDLIVRDKDGKINTVRYDQVNAMLLNEFLKEHRKVQEQGAAIAHQQKQIETLTAGLQKVSAQLAAANPSGGGLEATKSSPQLVNNP